MTRWKADRLFFLKIAVLFPALPHKIKVMIRKEGIVIGAKDLGDVSGGDGFAGSRLSANGKRRCGWE